MGPLNSKGKYDYVILTQALKHPTMVIARDPSRFEKEYQSDARDYLSRYGYMGGDLHFPLQFMNYTACPRQHLFYMDLEENDAF